MASESWPEADLESVDTCPLCGAGERSLALDGVEDWAFGCAPGRWQYWCCTQCRALYLHPRPTPASIGRAYGRYYTHGSGPGSVVARVKQRLRNEYWSHRFGASLQPRLGLPRGMEWMTRGLAGLVAEPFGLAQMAQSPKGLLIDVGCGNGDKLRLAQQLGWRGVGIEMDAAAVQAAVAQGLNVVQGGYELLARYAGQADCVVCSHVLEHVHQPLAFLRLLLESLKPQGVLLLSVPNASSALRDHYGVNWRGLEAPRHLVIPDAAWLVAWLQGQGWQCTQVSCNALETAVESERIRRRTLAAGSEDVRAARIVLRGLGVVDAERQDIVQLVCQRTRA
jgi:2-polyprenyl-3-methyl-5-hydroxy-6-metoxy-1,4-benzoquinol methylase